jgi:lipoprotein-releasing system ATP-binding protein
MSSERNRGNGLLLRAVGLGKVYDAVGGPLEVLSEVELEISGGEILAVVGPSGVGKSTLLHLLGCLDRPTTGRVIFDSVDVFGLPDDDLAELRNKKVGFVFQFHHLLREFDALENVAMPCLIAGMAAREAFEKAGELLEAVGLSSRRHHRPSELSGGEQQRVAVARALANDPKLMIADEPWGNLDRPTARAMSELLWKLKEEENRTYLIATHDMELASRADRVLEIRERTLRAAQGFQGG